MRVKWIEVILNIVFWVLTSWLIISMYSIEVQEIEIVNGKEIKQVIRNPYLIYYFSIGQFFFFITFYLELYFLKKLNETRKLNVFIYKSLGLILVCISVYYWVTNYLFFATPIRIPSVTFGILLFYITAALCYGFIKMWFQNEQDKNQLELVKNQSELSLLKAQLQPHFLFNTLNNLLSMVDQSHNPKLAESIDKLSGLLRYVVYETKKQKVSIDEEIQFIQNFSELHLLRFDTDEIDFKLTITGDYTQQNIEPGILLCYVENAFKHGVAPEENSFIHIDIDVSKENQIHFQVKNSIPNHHFSKQEGGSGIRSNLELLHIAYPNRHKISITQKENHIVELFIHTDERYNS